MSSDGSRLENGRVGGGWFGQGGAGRASRGTMKVGSTAIVWGGGDSHHVGDIEDFETGERVLLLVDSKSAISAVKQAGRKGGTRTKDLISLVETIERRSYGATVSLGWVK